MGKSDIKAPSTNSSLLVLSLHVNDANLCITVMMLTDLWKLDTLGIHDSSEKRSKTETQQLALKHFIETVSRDNTGRYKVNLPCLDGHPSLYDNKEMAQEVFKQWERE
ncbi:DUF1758 domain-containing protein, partial [Nephila pilipes]